MVCSLVHSSSASTLTTSSNSTAVARVVVTCLQDQERALLRLKRSFTTTTDSTMAFRSWKVGTDCCGWAGVRCGDADGRVTSLDLGNWGLESAGLDPALFDLTSLRYLNLAWNNFNSSKLPSIGFERLTNLTNLNLSDTTFFGEVPHNIGRLTNLVSLDLSVSFEIFEMPDYKYGFDPDSIGQLVVTNLTSLVANLVSLRELNLGWADLSESTDWCYALSMYARNLRVSWPIIHSSVFSSLATMTSKDGFLPNSLNIRN
nr:unnamed protein product [Digitaria exilis]